MVIIGIDPGSNGAACVLDSNCPGAPVSIWDFNKVPFYDLAKALHAYSITAVYVEDVHSIGGSSAKSNFGFGRSVGRAHALAEVVLRGSQPKLVTPKKWQKFIGVTAKGKTIKEDVANIAIGLYPNANIYGPRGGLLDGRSDALMIAHYGMQQEISL